MIGIDINSFKYDGDLMNSDGDWYVPDWVVDSFMEGDIYYKAIEGVSPSELFVKTIQGEKLCRVGDYVTITGGYLSVLGVI